uniref:Uncharacterized protein n=1 Tax=Vibrio tasmaniensis TaxID=212663 RepID=A0A0H3ZZ15_9VIBR|nr:hypothetical protein [Vibrio tasmaniensis]
MVLRAGLTTACGRAFGLNSFSASVEAIEDITRTKKMPLG